MKITREDIKYKIENRPVPYWKNNHISCINHITRFKQKNGYVRCCAQHTWHYKWYLYHIELNRIHVFDKHEIYGKLYQNVSARLIDKLCLKQVNEWLSQN